VPDVDLARQREVVGAFLAVTRNNDFDALIAVLDPDVVLRADRGAVPRGASRVVQGAPIVAEHTLRFFKVAGIVRPALINGTAGIVAGGRPFAVVGFT
jgi:hypothetical protein